LEWSQLRLLNFNQARGVPVPELVNLAEGFPETKSSAVLSEKLGDLCSAAGKPASAIRSYEQALQLNPSPQQRIRLRLALGEKLVAQNRDADALTNYNQLVADAPPYADLYPTYVKLVQLTEKLGKKDEAAKYLEKMKK
jgi:tetratricopeptide (TPR) repeat protein